MGPVARYIANGIIATVRYLAALRLILSSDISLDKDAMIAFCKVSALEHTNAIDSMTNAATNTIPISSIR